MNRRVTRPRRRGPRPQKPVAGSRPARFEPLENRALLAAVNFTGSDYIQSFDSLGTSLAVWTNDSTLPAWSLFNKTPAAITTIITNDGTNGSGSFFNFGTASASDRAIGGVASGGTYFGSPAAGSVAGWITVAITNNTGVAQNAFTFRYDGEQWRNGGNASAQTMVAQYGFGSSFTTVSTWNTPGAAFNFTSLQNTTTNAALDGNAAANRAANIGGSVTLASPWAVGTTLWIRWVETNDSGNDHGLAIDNFRFGLPTSNVTAPTAPSITGITAGDQRLTVAFTPPASDGGGVITNYQYSLNDGASWTTPAPAVTSSPLVITGLTNGQTYGVQLRAVNSAGAGTASTTVQGRPVGTGSLRVVSYNITAADVLPRTGLGTIVEAIGTEAVAGLSDQVDLLAIQEVASQATTSAAVAATLNGIYGSGTYAFGVLNGSSTGSGTQGVVYNTNSLRLLEEQRIGTASSSGAPRQTLRYKFQPKDGDATTVFYVYVSHFKSADTADDEARRNVEAQAIRADADALGPGASILYVGDFNVYRSTDASYQTLLAAGNGQAFDPIARPGDWHSNSSFVGIFTQAPLAVAPSGFTGGGLDDRFDFQLVSGELLDGSGLDYRSGSYRAFGNNGSVPRNGSINSSGNTALPGLANRTEVLNLLTTVSDHLPVVADYVYPTITRASQTITFDALPSKVTSDAPFQLAATASSGLAVSYVSSNLAVATVSGSTVTMVGPGTTTITASQAGDDSWLAAADVSQVLTVASSGTTTLFSEDFVTLTSGNSTSTSGSSTSWTGSANWSSVSTAYQAGGAVRLGASGSTGSISTKTLDLSGNGGSFTVSFDVKGWSTVEGGIVVTASGQPPQTVTYTATMASTSFDRKTLTFSGGTSTTTITFATTAKRAFLDNIVVTGGTPVPPEPASISGFAWVDADGDGTWDGNESAAAGWTIYLDQDGNGLLGVGERSAVTATDGSYSFTGLAAGAYTVAQVAQAGWTQTFPVAAAAQARSITTSSLAGSTTQLPDWAYTPSLRQQQKRLVPNDPLFPNQWHLRNTGQSAGTAGEDARLTSAWDVATGAGVVIGIVDDGLQGTHPDLSPAYRADLSYDFNGNDADPSPGTGDDHGTSAAGVAAARGSNGIGVSGSAPAASLAGIRLISLQTTDQEEADGLTYKPQDIDIYSNSWGPADDGLTLEAPGPLTRAALANAVKTGRGGLGSVYVWAAGNGLDANDNSNYDGYANSRFTIAVTAVDNRGKQSWYAEPGANILVAAPSSGDSSGVEVGITTTDRTGTLGYNTATSANGGDYANDFGGTSSATPLVSGVVALMLEANPGLGWRDVQHILATSARRNDPTDAGWSQNGAGKWVNHKYGFGVVDAAAAVNTAKTWTNAPAEVAVTSGVISVGQTIPDNNVAGVTSSFTIGQDITVESVEVVFTASHASRGNLQAVLTSPSGTRSILAEKHADTGDNYTGWTFSTVRSWGESAAGTWTLNVSDLTTGTTGSFSSWALNVYGTPGSSYVTPPPAHAITLVAGQNLTGINFGNRQDPVPTPVVVFDVPDGQTVTDTTLRSGATEIVKRGLGTLVLNLSNTHTGPTTVEAGTLRLAAADTLASSAVTVGTGGTLLVDPSLTIRSPAVTLAGGTLAAAGVTLLVNASSGIATFTITSGSVTGSPGLSVSGSGLVSLPTDRRQTVAVASLTIDEAGGGRIDIGKGRIDVAVDGTTEAALRADLVAGRGTGAFNGASGIMTTGGKATPSSANPAVGYRILGNRTAIVAWAAYGDANLDGQVNISDITLINNGQRFGKGSASGATWAQGDFNYSGGVTITDITLYNNAQIFNKGSYLPVTPSGTTVFRTATAGSSLPAEVWAAYAVSLEPQRAVKKR